MAPVVPTSQNPAPRLRLSGEGALPRADMWRAGNTRLGPGDPRWTLAVRIATSLTGPGERPRVWVGSAHRARVRRFGALLGFSPHEVDAIGSTVLEAAARGDDPVGALHEPAVAERLAAVRRPDRAPQRRDRAGDGVAVALGAIILLTSVALLVMHAG